MRAYNGGFYVTLSHVLLSAFCFGIAARPAPERRRLIAAFEELRANPNRAGDYYVKDATGRTLSVWACRPFLITYWLDAFVSEVRIVDVQRVRY